MPKLMATNQNLMENNLQTLEQQHRMASYILELMRYFPATIMNRQQLLPACDWCRWKLWTVFSCPRIQAQGNGPNLIRRGLWYLPLPPAHGYRRNRQNQRRYLPWRIGFCGRWSRWESGKLWKAGLSGIRNSHIIPNLTAKNRIFVFNLQYRFFWLHHAGRTVLDYFKDKNE